jgi:hypothetical protein
MTIFASLALASCMSPVLGDKTATIVIATSPATGSRALTDGWPMGGLPVFSDITVSVLDSDGNEMLLPREPVVSGNSITVTVVAGKNLTLVVDAAPDWDATAAAYDTYEGGFPMLVNMYSGRKIFSVNAGATTAVTIELATGGTKILLPMLSSVASSALGIADSFTSSTINTTYDFSDLSIQSYFSYDRYGHLLLSRNDTVYAYSDLSSAFASYYFGSGLTDIVLSEASNRLYGLLESDGFILEFLDLDDSEPVAASITIPSGYSLSGYGVAADGLGRVYVPAYYDASNSDGILRLSVDDLDGTLTAASGFVSLESIGLQYTVYYVGGDIGTETLQIEDMRVVNGILYILGSQVTSSYSISGISSDNAYSRGKIVAVDTSTMKKLWETGWNSSRNFPSSDTDSSIFAGPRRFVAMAPKRLYVLDDGFGWLDHGLSETIDVSEVNRVIEIDTARGAIVSSTIFTGEYSVVPDYLYLYSGGYIYSDLFTGVY